MPFPLETQFGTWLQSKHKEQKQELPLCATGTSQWYQGLSASPFSDTATIALTKAAFEHHHLGQDKAPDLLAVSLSATDKKGHRYGPSSAQAKDNLLRVDRHIEELLDYLDPRIGPQKYLVILSADHGGLDSVQTLRARDLKADTLLQSEIAKAAIGYLKVKKKRDYQPKFSSPYVWPIRKNLPKLNTLSPEWKPPKTRASAQQKASASHH